METLQLSGRSTEAAVPRGMEATDRTRKVLESLAMPSEVWSLGPVVYCLEPHLWFPVELAIGKEMSSQRVILEAPRRWWVLARTIQDTWVVEVAPTMLLQVEDCLAILKHQILRLLTPAAPRSGAPPLNKLLHNTNQWVTLKKSHRLRPST